MQVELSEQDIANTIVVLEKADIKGAEAATMAILIQTFKVALQSSAPEVEEPAAQRNGASPKVEKAKEKQEK